MKTTAANRRNRQRSQNYHYGTLEPRKMLAGNVTAFFNGSHLYVRGDQHDNQIEIVAEDGQMKIVGTNDTTVNRSNDGFVVSGSISVDGSERVKTRIDGGLRVHMGPGNDTIETREVQFGDFSIVYGGSGDDDVNVQSSSFRDKLFAQTFSGDDTLSFTDSLFMNELRAISLDGEDTIMMKDSVAHGKTILASGNHDDHVMLMSSRFLGDQQLVLTQDGSDVVEVQSPFVSESSSLSVYAGTGNDHVMGELAGGTMKGQVTFAGQQGNDMEEMTVVGNASNIAMNGFEFDGEVVFDNGVFFEGGVDVFSKPTDNSSFFMANPIELDQTTRISSVDWRGGYEAFLPPQTDSFVIEFFESGIVDIPWTEPYEAPVGEAIARFDIGDDANRTDTGLTWQPYGPARPIYSFSANIDFEMKAGKTYWISIFVEPDVESGADYDNLFFMGVASNPEFSRSESNVTASFKWPQLDFWTSNATSKMDFALRS